MSILKDDPADLLLFFQIPYIISRFLFYYLLILCNFMCIVLFKKIYLNKIKLLKIMLNDNDLFQYDDDDDMFMDSIINYDKIIFEGKFTTVNTKDNYIAP